MQRTWVFARMEGRTLFHIDPNWQDHQLQVGNFVPIVVLGVIVDASPCSSGSSRASYSRLTSAIHVRIGGRKSGSSGSVGETFLQTVPSHILARLTRKQDSTMQSTNPHRYLVGICLGRQERRSYASTRTNEIQEQQATNISTPKMPCTSSLSALMVLRSRNTEFQWQSRS